MLTSSAAVGSVCAHSHEHDHHHHHHHHHHDHHDHDHGHKHEHHAHDHEHHAHDHGHHKHNDVQATEAHAHAHAHTHRHEHAHSHSHTHSHSHSHDHSHKASSDDQRKINRFDPAIWAEALFATALVGAAPVVVLLFVPLGIGNQETQKPLLRVFLSFAAGGLLGDALLHLLPHSMPHGHSHDHAHDHADGHEGHSHSVQDLAVWLWTIAGMMTFLMLEKFVRAQTGGGHSHGHSHSHGHGHSHGSDSPSETERTRVEKSSNQRNDANLRKRTSTKSKSEEKEDAAAPVADDKRDESTNAHKQIAAAGYLNLAADFTHNFTDGLAIGATFLRGSGWQTTLAMLLHELPHEIGDFAILIQSGFTRREAMLTQFATAVGAMIGTVIGLLMEGAGDSSSAWISPFTAGGFIYIACASVMPELLEDCSLAQSLKEGVAMCLGIALMVLIALTE
ncbi:hypothetical protein PINS_up007240 [Pythium insidiosum]|nr:hypothetical protein PINS_up007240 [Pythium insidiosum]